jgi:hypothetical protein
MLIKGIKLVDRISVPTQRTMTDAGQMIVPCAFARIGTQMYTKQSLGLGDSKDVVSVVRDEADVFAEDAMASFRSAPITMGHPKNNDGSPLAVSADNAAQLQVGMLEGIPTRDEDLVTGTIVIANQTAIDAVVDGMVELSAGYTCDIEEVDGVHYQRNIRANHIAIVPKGRAGSSCSLADAMIGDDHEEPMRWEYLDDASYDLAMEIWKENEAAEQEDDQKKLQQDAAESLTLITDELKSIKQLLADTEEVILVRDAAMSTLQAKLDDALETQEVKVHARVDVITKAQELTDMSEFADKSNKEIKLAVLADCKPNLNLDGKDDAYIDARFEILVEDASEQESPMSKELRKQSTVVVDSINPVYVDPSIIARNKMLAAQAKLSL